MRHGWAVMLAGIFLLTPWPSRAAGTERQETQLKAQEQDQQVYGWQLMSPEERLEYRNRIRAAQSRQEREEIRAEHHERMKIKAKTLGVVLPEEPGPWGQGKGMGPGGGRNPRQ